MGTSINGKLSGGRSVKERIRPSDSGSPSTPPKHWTSGLNFLPFAKVRNSGYFGKRRSVTERHALKEVIEALSYAHPTQANLTEIPNVQTDCQALYYYLEKAEGIADTIDGEFFLVKDDNGQIVPVNKFDVDGFNSHAIVPLRPIWEIKHTNPVLFKVLASIVHYLINVNDAPVFQRDLLGYVNPEMSYTQDDIEEDDLERVENDRALKSDYEYYRKDAPAKALNFINKMKPLSLNTILEYPAKGELKGWINQAVKVIDSKVKFWFEEIDSPSVNEELDPANVCYITWDCDSLTEQEYGHFLDCHANEVGVKTANQLLRPCQTGWIRSGNVRHLENLFEIIREGYTVISDSRLKHQPKKYAK